MRNRLLIIIALAAMLLSPMTAVAEPSTSVKSKVSDEAVINNIQLALASEVGQTKEEKAAREIESNLKKIEEQRIASAVKAKATVAVKTVNVVANTGNADAIAYGQLRNAQVFGEAHWPALYQLWMKESGWRDTALNRSSGACGIPQFINGCVLGDHVGQIEKGLVYIQRRYGNPTNAWNFWLTHHWY